MLVTALAYFLVGALALGLAIPPSFAMPLYPAAGVGLAAALVYGRPALAGIALGAFGLNLVVNLLGRTGTPGLAVASAAVIATAAMLQAAAGAALVRRFVAQPLTLSEPRDVVRFGLLGGALACLISASLSVPALHALGMIPADAMADAWWLWWTGDGLGVLIGAPAVLTLIGRPRADWAHRRLTVGLSLLLVTLLLATASAQVARWDRQRTWVIFDRDATRWADALVSELRRPIVALRALRNAAQAVGHVSEPAVRAGSTDWLQDASFHLKAMGWEQLVPRRDVPAFEQAVRAELQRPGYHVFERHDAQAAPEARSDADVLPIRYIEPMSGNAGALGVSTLSIAPARPALLATLNDEQPHASGGFRLTQAPTHTGVVIYQGLRLDGQQGVMFVTLDMHEAMSSLAERLPGYLQWCLIDLAPTRAGEMRLAGPPGCEQAPGRGTLAQQRAIDFAGRHWQLRLTAPDAAVPDTRHWDARLFSLLGLSATALLGALLLTVTGRTRRIEVAVAERTVDLEREIAERRRTEAALRESEQRLRNILDHIPIGVIYTDLDGHIKETNPALRALVGYAADELDNLSVLRITHPEDRAGDLQMGRRLIAGEVPMYRRTKRYIGKDGRMLWVQSTVSLLRDPQGRPQRLVGVVEDITEHLRLQDAERAREHAEAASRAKTEFVSRMSHELRTPLNAMLGFAQLLELDRQAPLQSRHLEWVGQIQQAGWHLLHMINDTLDLSRIEAGTLRLEIGAVALAPAVQATRALVEQAAQRRRVTIEQQLAPGTDLRGDATRVKQILTNLLSNAIKYNVDGGRVRIASRRLDAHTVEVEVSDTGLGLSDEQLKELFQPFNRLGRDNQIEGTGIGLVISRRLAELMEGTLTAEARPGGGATFRLHLPSADEPAAPADAQAMPSDTPLADYHRRIVLYIEDNDANAEVMRGILAQRPQVSLHVCKTGLDGMTAARERCPSLVLLDMHLPDVDGLELLRRLKHDPLTGDIPVVAVSADATAARADRALAMGAARYVTKPVDVARMLQLLDELLAPQETRF
jgi:PAS domain S-box-containing protein